MICNHCGAFNEEVAPNCSGCGNPIVPSDSYNAVQSRQNGPVGTPQALPLENTNGPLPNAPTVPHNYRRYLFCAVVAVLLIVSFAFLMQAQKKRTIGYFYAVLGTSVQSYRAQISEIVNVNPILSEIIKMRTNPHSIKFSSNTISAALHNDTVAKTIGVEIPLGPGIPIAAKLYLSNTQLILGLPGLVFLELNPANIQGDIKDFMGNSKDLVRSGLIGDLDGVTITYDSVAAFDIAAIAGIRAELLQCQQAVKRLFDRSQYTYSKSLIMIGKHTKKCEQLTIVLEAEQIQQWLLEDLGLILKDNQRLKGYANGLLAQFAPYVHDTVTVRVLVYQKKVVAIEVTTLTGDGLQHSLAVKAVGQNRRLETILLQVLSGDNSFYATMDNQCFDKEQMRLQVTTETTIGGEAKGGATFDLLLWDLTSQQENFMVQLPNSGQKVYSFYAQNGHVMIQNTQGYLEMGPLLKPNVFPSKTLILRESDLEDLLEALGPLQDFIKLL